MKIDRADTYKVSIKLAKESFPEVKKYSLLFSDKDNKGKLGKVFRSIFDKKHNLTILERDINEYFVMSFKDGIFVYAFTKKGIEDFKRDYKDLKLIKCKN